MPITSTTITSASTPTNLCCNGSLTKKKNAPEAAIVGFDLGGDVQVVVLAPHDFEDRIRSSNRCREGCYAIDGTEDVKGFTILQLGIQDVQHRFQPVAYALVSGGEGAGQVRRFLEILGSNVNIASHCREGLDMRYVMLDGARGLIVSSCNIGNVLLPYGSRCQRARTPFAKWQV